MLHTKINCSLNTIYVQNSMIVFIIVTIFLLKRVIFAVNIKRPVEL